jgi:hypothetical protein
MNLLFTILISMLCIAVLFALVHRWTGGFRRSRRVNRALTLAFHAPVGFLRGMSFGSTFALANIAEGTHDGMITKLADAAYGRNLVYKVGSDADHIATAGVADIPLGVSDDESAAAEDPLDLLLLGSIRRTVLAQASAAVITQGDYVVPAANGQVRKLPTASGTYYIIGRALNTTAGNSGDLCEFDPCVPVQRVVP